MSLLVVITSRARRRRALTTSLRRALVSAAATSDPHGTTTTGLRVGNARANSPWKPMDCTTTRRERRARRTADHQARASDRSRSGPSALGNDTRLTHHPASSNAVIHIWL